MAEVVASMVVGPLLSIVKEKASSYLLDQYKVMEGMEEQHKILKRKLPAILDIIADAEQAASHREGVRAWLDEVKTVAYEANEVFDEFKYEALRRQAKKKGHYVKHGFDVIKLFPTHNRIVFRYRMGNKLCRIVQAIEVLVAEMNAFGFKYEEQVPASKQWRQTDHVVFDPKKIIGTSRDQDKKKIVDILVGQASNADLAVVPIVGIGGLGKTTLAQLVYNEPEIGKHFELLLWVYVSDSFDVDSLAKSIVEAASKKDDPEAASKKTPLDKLQNIVSGHRYLLVLDDVWNRDADKWELLKARLQHGGKGSAVLTTTRDGGVAKIMGTVQAHNLSVLEDKFINKIIKTRAFGLQKKEEWPPVLVNMVDEIVKRCAGSPLAATALGSVLRTKTSEEEWKAISSSSSICTEESGILPILKLSYNDLPAHMRQCFAFCAVFLKDYEIEVDKLIQLWIAHGFIPEQKGVRLETIGKQIFNELASRSFFQDVKQVLVKEWLPIRKSYCRNVCRLHDLMHDVALSVMEKECAIATDEPSQIECAAATEEPSQMEWLPNTARHLLLSCEEPETVLNDSLAKRSPAIQTLLCDSYMRSSLQHLSKYSSLQALQLHLHGRLFPLKPKHLHHLRYLDLSRSRIKALPEDITILYNLQTLNLSGCLYLDRLPRQMKYMTALRHLYTQGCPELKSMPGGLGKLISLQTLTCFVAGKGSDCSDVGELQHLNLGGHLGLHQLENVTEEDAKKANIGEKKELSDLTLQWTVGHEDDARVLEGLKPHDGLQSVRIDSYGASTFPTWMAMLRNMVEIHLFHCANLQCLFRSDTSFTFPNLKEITLQDLQCVERWWEINSAGHGEERMFPELEKLTIINCKKLTALPQAALLSESSGTMVRSAFPALKVLKLENLKNFQRWEAVEGTEREYITFPELEKLSIQRCPILTALSEAPFPALKVLKLKYLKNLQKWEAMEGTQGQEMMFPQLEKLLIEGCGKLTALPGEPTFPNLKNVCIEQCPELTMVAKSPMLSVLATEGREEDLFMWVARHMTSLTNLKLESLEDTETTCLGTAEQCLSQVVDGKEKLENLEDAETTCLGTTEQCLSQVVDGKEKLENLEDAETTSGAAEHSLRQVVDGKEKWNHEFPLAVMELRRLKSGVTELCACFVQLQELLIQGCNGLVHWPEKEFQSLVSLRKLTITSCNKLTGYAQAAPLEPSTSSETSRPLLPSLESLQIISCESLVEVFNIPACLRSMAIYGCLKVEFIFGRKLQQEPGAYVSEVSSSVDGAPRDQRLESLDIRGCGSLTGSLDLPLSLKTLKIINCHGLRSLESHTGELPSLETLYLEICKTLSSLPDGQQAYSSLQSLTIRGCPDIKTLPACLQQRLGSLEVCLWDARYQAPWKYIRCL